ncbi:hypothetical protein [Nostoc sp.]|uniref:hypothetical protein n=1 Tax=Nostoc sp. TaxID=1180 RepID=UPI002FF8A5AC
MSKAKTIYCLYFLYFLGILNTVLAIDMTFLTKINWNLLRKNAPNSSGIDPSAPSLQPVILKQPATPSTPKNLAELEHEMELDDGERNRVSSQLQSIINQLEKVQNGTTAYLKAQELLLSANNKLRQLQVK